MNTKFKKIFSSLLCAALAASSIAFNMTVAAEGESVPSITYVGGKVTVNSESPLKAVLAAAMYGEDGSMESVVLSNIDTEDGAATIDVPFGSKVMLWDSVDSMKPLTAAVQSKDIKVEFPTSSIDVENSIYRDGGAAANIAQIYASIMSFNSDDQMTATEYRLANSNKSGISNNAELFVNGVKVDWTADNIQEYIIDNKIGTVTLVDTPMDDAQECDGYYDFVNVTYYKSAIVESVASTGKIYLYEGEQLPIDGPDAGAPIKTIGLYQNRVDDGSLKYTITLNGEQISLSEIQENDVISVAYDVTNDFADSSFYDIIVTRGTVEGKITSHDVDNKTYTVGGITYKYDENRLPSGFYRNAVGIDAKLYIDAFGRIVLFDEIALPEKYAILDNVWYETGSDNWMIRLITPDCRTLDYVVKDDNKACTENGKEYATTVDYLADIIYNTNKDGLSSSAKYRTDIQDRVVTYKVNASDEIHTIKTASAKSVLKEEYIESANKIGSLKLNEKTAAVDASEYICTEKVSDLHVIPALVDEVMYTAYGYGKLSDGSYSFVIITAGIGSFTDKTQIAVFVKSTVEANNDGDATDAITILYDNQQKTYLLDGITADQLGLDKGDIIVFKTNSSNEIDNIIAVACLGLCDGTNRVQYDLDGYSIDANKYISNIPAWNKDMTPDTDVKLDFGAIIDKTPSDFTIVEYGETDSEHNKRVYNITDDTKVYVYNYMYSASKALYIGTKTDIVKTLIPMAAKDDNDNIVDWSEVDEYAINYAFVKAVDDVADQVVVIIGPGRSNY